MTGQGISQILVYAIALVVWVGGLVVWQSIEGGMRRDALEAISEDEEAAAALKANSIVMVYPEGRIGLDPGLWPERAKTGLARLAPFGGGEHVLTLEPRT